jgi:exosortase
MSGRTLPLLLAAAAAAALYSHVLAGLVAQWWNEPASSHGLLLVLVAGLVVYRRREALRATALQPRDAGLGVALFGLLIYVAGTITGDVFIVRLSLPVVITGAILLLGGTAHMRMLLAPVALLLLAVPLPNVVVTHATMPLQLIASQVAASVLQFCQVDVVRQGNLLTLDRITLEVADVCSGLRSLVSLVSVTAVCITAFSLSLGRSVMLLAAAIPVAVVGNGLRVAATGLLATWFGEGAARGVVHDATGYAAFIFMCATIVLMQILSKPTESSAAPAPEPARA